MTIEAHTFLSEEAKKVSFIKDFLKYVDYFFAALIVAFGPTGL